MKKYSINKNFIPKSFIEKHELDRKRNNKRSFLLIVVAVLVFLPNTITFIFNNSYDKKDNYEKDEEISTVNNINDESFNKWMDIIKGDTKGTFNNENAVIYIDGMDRFEEVLNNKNIEVNDVEDIGDKKYKVQITLSEKE